MNYVPLTQNKTGIVLLGSAIETWFETEFM